MDRNSLKALKNNVQVDLSHQEISDSELLELTNFIAQNEKLEKLDLSDNQLTDKAAHLLAEVLKKDNHLRYLNLFGNHITNAGAEELLEAVKDNIYLLSLSLGEFNKPDLLDGKLCGEIKLYLSENQKLYKAK